MAEETRAEVSITLDGREVSARPGELLIQAAERAGTYIPRFCYHPRMEPVGVCRMCLVEVEGPRGATLQPACYLRVADNMSVVTDSEKVKKAQDGVMEFLLANHPLDCPVCDKGGECPLQDQALAHGSGETRFVEEKRHFVKPLPLGELILLDRERCIQCSRCTRFAAEVAGDAQIDFAGRGEMVEVAASPTQPFDSVFSGNTVQICPVGALTATPYRFSARPWDLDQVESSCTTCAVQCRVAVQSSADRLTRVLGLDSEPVNHGWLCDKGRFTLDSVDGNPDALDPLDPATRVTEPMVRRDGRLEVVTWGEALRAAADALREGARDADGVGAIGGAALTNEGAFAWQRFVRGVLGSEHLDAQYGDGLDARLVAALPGATIDEMAGARVVVTLTGDLREELPILFLRLREALVKGRTRLVEFATGASALRALATVALTTRPGEAHRVAQALASGAPAHDLAVDDATLGAARELLGETGEGVVVVVGRANLAEGAPVVETAVRALAERFPDARFLPALRRANVRGALDMGLAPGLAPGRRLHEGIGRDTPAQLAAMADGRQRAVLLLGGSLLGNVADVDQARAALERARVVAVTGHGGATLAHADVVLPATVSYERDGTVTTLEGRVSSLHAKLAAPGSAWPDVAIAAELAEEFGQSLGVASVEEAARVVEETTGYPTMSAMLAAGEGVVAGRPNVPATRRALDPMAFPGIRSIETSGLLARVGATSSVAAPSTPAAAPVRLEEVAAGRGVDVPHADAYAWRLHVGRRLYDRGVAMRGSPALGALVGPTTLGLNHLDLDRLGVTDGDEVVAVGPRGEARLPVRRDDAVPRGVAEVAFATLSADGEDVVRSWLSAGALTAEIALEVR
ncbi:MAG: NADH-quinone oxidoreductase subunit NuoG [Acidobacteriota bacterium]|nr:NADH-quinone oxidoreductase subunit NuoG [Acidobacteriota bacterium]